MYKCLLNLRNLNWKKASSKKMKISFLVIDAMVIRSIKKVKLAENAMALE
jgi:hypothetical protein